MLRTLDSRLRGNDGGEVRHSGPSGARTRNPDPEPWIPAFAGMTEAKFVIPGRGTKTRNPRSEPWIPAFAGMTERHSSFRAEWSEDPESRLRNLDSRLRGNDGGKVRHSGLSGAKIRNPDSEPWIPAFAGMTEAKFVIPGRGTKTRNPRSEPWIPAFAGMTSAKFVIPG